MDKRKRKRLESAGWKVGNVSEFLGLTEEETTVVELKFGLATAVKEQRSQRSLTQEQLGRIPGSSQSRVAKMEARMSESDLISCSGKTLHFTALPQDFSTRPVHKNRAAFNRA
jgi:hypothetical protein